MRPLALREVLVGMALLGRFRRAGFAHLGGGTRDVLASVAALLPMLLISPGLPGAEPAGGGRLASMLVSAAMLLLPMIVSEALARRWGREAEWGRYIVAVNWSRWLVIGVALGAMIGMRVLAGAGLPPGLAVVAGLGAVGGYDLALQWFLARRGLDVSAGRAVLLVVVVEMLTGLLLLLFLALHGEAATEGSG